MAKRPVSAQELAAVASRFNGTPVADNPREFDFPDTAASDAWNKAVDRLEAGETLDAVLGKSDSHVASDVARGFVGGAARQVLDPAVDASRALLPSGWGVEAAVERLGGGKKSLTESDLYKKATYVPETKAGTLGSYLPVAAGIATGIAAEGVIPTAVTLGGAVAGEKTARGVADVLASDPRFNLTPEQLEAWKNMAGTVGMIAGGGYAHGKAPKVTIPEAIAAGKQRAYGAVLGGVKGYQLGGIPTGALGSIAGVVNPEAVALADKPAIMRMLKKGALGPQLETPTVESPKLAARAPKAEQTLASQRQAKIDAGLKVATEAQSQEALTPKEAATVKTVLEQAQDAHVANGEEVPAPIAAQLARVNRELSRAKLPATEAKVNDLMEVYGPTGVAGRVDLVTDATSKKDYAAVQRHLASYVNAGEQPPAALVELFDRLREHRIASNKSVSAEAYDVATAQLVDAAAQGPQAYKQALAAIPKQTRALLQNVDASLLSTLESRAKNAGGRLGKPADDPWFTLMNDVLGEWARPQSVEVPVESPGGSFTVPSNVEMRRTPGAAVAVDVSSANRGGRLTPRPVTPSLESAVATAIEEGRQPSSVSVGPSSPSGSATVPSGVDVVRVPGAAVSVPAGVAEPAATSATASATPAAPAEPAAAPANSATARAAKRGKSELGYSPRLSRQHDATTLSAAARMLQLAHDITLVRESNPKALKSVVKNPQLDEALVEFERLARLFAGQGKVSSFATTRENIPNIGTVNGWIANSTNLTPRMKAALGVTVAKD